jgi:hypothetical protein
MKLVLQLHGKKGGDKARLSIKEKFSINKMIKSYNKLWIKCFYKKSKKSIWAL